MTRERFEELKKNGVEKVRYHDIITGFGDCFLSLKNIFYDDKIGNCKNICEAQDNFEEPLLVDLNFLYEVENPKKEHIKLTEEQKNIETMHKLLVEALEREKQKDKKIKELEEKLAESEKQRKHLKDWLDDEILTSVDHESYYATINEYEEEVKKLKQQLAEKEQELLEIKQRVAEKASKEFQEMIDKRENHNQDKISFAVDILEELADCSNYINSKLDFECGSYVSEKAIRDKIKYLKGKKDE